MSKNYYPINETAARQAKEMMSHSDYVEGSATRAYQSEVDSAYERVERHKRRVDKQFHEKIDSMFDKYCRRLAAYYNKENEIGTRCPSVLVAGFSNFPVGKKEKQVKAWENNHKEYEDLSNYLEKICSVGTGGISSDDPNAVEMLKEKLAKLEAWQTKAKGVNAYYRKNKTLDGCPLLTAEEIERLKASMKNSWHYQDKPFMSYELTNNNQNIRRIKQRIEELEKIKGTEFEGWTFDGGEVVIDKEDNRVKIIYDSKPDEGVRANLKANGFHWSRYNMAWQRQLNANGIRAAKEVTGQK